MKLGNVCSILNGFAFKSDKYVHEGIRIIRISNVQKGYIEDKVPAFYPYNSEEAIKYKLECGDILISLTGNVGRVAILTAEFLPATLNQRVACLRIKNESKLDKSFLFNYLSSDRFEQQCIVSSKGVAQKNMSTEWLKEYEMPDLTIKQQKEISQILSELSALIIYGKRQLAKLDELVKSRFVEMFGDPMTNPKGYPCYTVGDIIKFQGGSQPDKKYFEYVPSKDNIRLIQIRDYKSDKYITYIPRAMAKRFCTAEDIMIGRYGPPIFQILKGIEGSFNVALMKATPKQGNREFIRAFLKQDCLLEYLEGLSQRTAGQDGIQMDKLKAYPFPYPPIALQDRFATFVAEVDKSKLAVKQSLEKLETLKKSLMQQYF